VGEVWGVGGHTAIYKKYIQTQTPTKKTNTHLGCFAHLACVALIHTHTHLTEATLKLNSLAPT